MFSLTRSVVEHFNPNEAEFNSESFGFSPLESTGLEWNYYPVDELIYQEYGDKEVTSAGNVVNVHVRVINAFSPEDSEDTQDKKYNRAMAWKRLRPSIIRTVWNSLYIGFLISILSAVVIGAFSIVVFYVYYQTTLVCLDHPKKSIPIKVQWSRTISQVTNFIFIRFWFYVNTLFLLSAVSDHGIEK